MSQTLSSPTTAELSACPTRLTPEQIETYERTGFIAFRDVLSPEEVEACKTALLDVVEVLRPNHRTMKNGYGNVWAAPDSALKIQFQKGHEPGDAYDPTAVDKVRKFHDFVGSNATLTHLATAQEKIQGVLQSLIGADSIMMQNMALVNPPLVGTGKPWHQDDAYFKVAPLEAVCGVWIALDEAGIENGCMNFLSGWNLKGALAHYHGSDCEIVPDRLNEEEVPVPVPLPPGGAVFFCGVAPHMTKPNTSSERRRALQFHFRSLDSRIVDDAEYDEIFVEADGTPASCSAAARRDPK